MDIVVQHFAVASAQLHRHSRLLGRDLEALDADVTGLKVESAHDSRPPRHRPQRDRQALRAAGSDLDPLIVLPAMTRTVSPALITSAACRTDLKGFSSVPVLVSAAPGAAWSTT